MPSTRARRIASALLVLVVSASAARAQGIVPVGTPLETGALVVGDVVSVGAECDPDIEDSVFAAGGSTLLVATTAGGPLITSLFVPFDSQSPCPVFSARGVPPGTYWLLFVVGRTTVTSAPATYWARVVVGPGCSGPPGVPAVNSSVSGHLVTLVLSGAGCPWTQIEVSAGTTPGASDVGTFVVTSPQLTYPGVPNGQYYVRARAFNTYGASRWSLEQPVRVPACGVNNLLPQAPLNPAVSVGAGNVVTLSWSHTTLAWLTFHQLAVKASNGDLVDTFVLPATATTISASVPSGAYRIGLMSGGPCGRSVPITGDITFTVP